MSVENLSEQFSKHNALVQNLAGEFADLRNTVENLEARANRPERPDGSFETNAAGKIAFEAYTRRGAEKVANEYKNALETSNDPGAGYLAPADYERVLAKTLTQLSPIRAISNVGTTAAGEILLPKRTQNLTGWFVGETEQRSETAPSYGMNRIPLGTIASYCDVSVDQLEDSAFPIAEELMQNFGEAFAAVESNAFVNADGTKGRPLGLLQTSGIATAASGAATSVIADALINVVYNLPAAYRARATWCMNATTLAAISKLKDGSGAFLWSPSIQAGQPSQILGIKVAECPDLPDLSAGSKSIVVGDFSKFRIFGKPNGGVSVLRDQYTLAASGLVRFHGRFRVGAAVTMTEAFRIVTTGV